MDNPVDSSVPSEPVSPQAASSPVPAMMPAAASSAPRYAGFWVRFAAAVIDGIVLSIVTAPIAPLTGSRAIAQMCSLLFVLAYYSFFESSHWQATLGKHAFRLRVTDEHGMRLTFVHALGRACGRLLSGLIFGIGYLMIAFTKKKQGLHDMLARTFVIRA